MDLDKKIFNGAEASLIEAALKKAESLKLIKPVVENNAYLICSYAGTGVITPKWSVKLYSYSKNKKGHSLVCTDIEVLKCFVGNNFNFKPPDLKLLKIDDAGWGFPLCGVMIGATDEAEVHTDVVPVEFFQGDNFTCKKYLDEYSARGVKLIREKFDAAPATHRIEICSGFVNRTLRDELRRLGFHVRIIEVKGLLQDELEERFRQYVGAELNTDIYYDPKEIDKNELPKKFREVLEFGKKHFPLKLKTGWRSIGDLK